MKKIVFLSAAIIISATFAFVGYSMLTGGLTPHMPSDQPTPRLADPNQPNPNTAPIEIKDSTLRFTNEFISFDYPSDLSLSENPDGVAFISIASDDSNNPLLIKAYLEETAANTFDEYYSSLEMSSFGVSEVPEGAYFFHVSETYNELPVIIHKRDFGGILGEVNEVYVWLGGGKIVKFYAEPNHPAIEVITKSLRKP